MDIAYKRQNNKKNICLSKEKVQAIATEFFEITDFENMQSTEYFDSAKQNYVFNPSFGTLFEYQITNLEITQEGAIVTAEFYKDPLQTQKEKIIKYTFKKVN